MGDNNSELQQDCLTVLRKWHSEFPPDEYERNRNAAAFEKQGNRNPLIDHPEWVESIDFALGVGEFVGSGKHEADLTAWVRTINGPSQ